MNKNPMIICTTSQILKKRYFSVKKEGVENNHLLGNLIRRTFNQVATSGKRGNLLTKGFRG